MVRRRRDSNSRYGFPYAAFRVRYLQPLSHVSSVSYIFKSVYNPSCGLFFR